MADHRIASFTLSGRRVFPVRSGLQDRGYMIALLLLAAGMGILLVLSGSAEMAYTGWGLLGAAGMLGLTRLLVMKRGELVLDDRGLRMVQNNLLGSRSIRADYADIQEIVYYHYAGEEVLSQSITYQAVIDSTAEELGFRRAVLVTRSGKDLTLNGADYAGTDLKEIVTILEQGRPSLSAAVPGPGEPLDEPSVGEKKRTAGYLSHVLLFPFALSWAVAVGLAASGSFHDPSAQLLRIISLGLLTFFVVSGIVAAFQWPVLKNLTWSMIDHRSFFSRLALMLGIMAAPFLITVVLMKFHKPEQQPALQDDSFQPGINLIHALSAERFDEARDLISRGEPVNAVDNEGRTALLAVCCADTPQRNEIVTLLVAKGADVNSRNEFGATPLVLAADAENLSITKLLLQRGAEVNTGRLGTASALALAVERGNAEVVQLLLKHRADPNYRDGNEQNCNQLPLQRAIVQHHGIVVALLLKAKVDVDRADACGWTALMTAVQAGDADTVRLLVKQGADVNGGQPRQDTALIRAVTNKKQAITTQLIKAGADVDRQGQRGWTALMNAAEQGEAAVLKELLRAGARVDIKSDDGVTVLQIAEQKGDQDVLAPLKAAGARQ